MLLQLIGSSHNYIVINKINIISNYLDSGAGLKIINTLYKKLYDFYVYLHQK